MKIRLQTQGLEKVQSNLAGIILKLKDMKKYFELVGQYMQHEVDDHFKKEETPDGQKWKPLSNWRIKQRMKRHKQGNMKILQDSGELKRSIKYQADTSSVTLGSNLKYAKIHQYGGTVTIKREGTYKHNYSKKKRKGEKYSYQRRVKIPARQYLGITKQEIEHMKELLVQYLKRGG